MTTVPREVQTAIARTLNGVIRAAMAMGQEMGQGRGPQPWQNLCVAQVGSLLGIILGREATDDDVTEVFDQV